MGLKSFFKKLFGSKEESKKNPVEKFEEKQSFSKPTPPPSQSIMEGKDARPIVRSVEPVKVIENRLAEIAAEKKSKKEQTKPSDKSVSKKEQIVEISKSVDKSESDKQEVPVKKSSRKRYPTKKATSPKVESIVEKVDSKVVVIEPKNDEKPLTAKEIKSKVKRTPVEKPVNTEKKRSNRRRPQQKPKSN